MDLAFTVAEMFLSVAEIYSFPSKKFIDSRTWHDSFTDVTLLSHSCDTIVPQLCDDLFL